MTFEHDDKLIMLSPFTGTDSIVNYRGESGMGDDKVVVWTGTSQITIPSNWLRKQD